ncbi:hypothetical protein ACFWXH_04565 [Mesorhizobium sp. NPDC059054]|uniref:hypothetical protein n=1 Tax=Mesorhizobium sp. NPDC059054 TaxID=3346711 RepID=UPI0036BD2E7D
MNSAFVYDGAMIENLVLALVPALVAGDIVVVEILPLHGLAVACLLPAVVDGKDVKFQAMRGPAETARMRSFPAASLT